MLFIYRDEEVTEKGIRQYIEDNDVIFGLSFGPVLVDGGEIVPCSDYPIGEIGLEYTRAAIGIKDELHYLCMIDNKTGGHGSKIDRAAEYMQEKGCVKAYALDGGQTATISMQGKTVNLVDFGTERTMSDIICFASALPEEERPGT